MVRVWTRSGVECLARNAYLQGPGTPAPSFSPGPGRVRSRLRLRSGCLAGVRWLLLRQARALHILMCSACSGDGSVIYGF